MHTFQVKLGILSAYHPQTDRQTEKVDHVISTYLRAFPRHNPNSWHKLLPMGEYAYNSSVHASTGKTPFELDLGYTPRLPIDIAICIALNYPKPSKLGTMAISFAQRMKLNLELAWKRLRTAQDSQKVSADEHRQDPKFKIGQQIWLNTKNLSLTYSNLSDQRSCKLRDIYDGPFQIFKASQSPNAWYLDIPKSWNIRQPLNVSLFKLDSSDPTRIRTPPPPVKNSIYGAEYLVESVVGHEERQHKGKRRGQERWYRLHWTGWEDDHDIWEPLSGLENCEDLVNEYHDAQGWSRPTWPRGSKRRRVARV
jgi:hypothetical protein